MVERLTCWAFARTPRGSRFLEPIRTLVRILLILVHVTIKTGLLLRASALTYSIILSLVPMLAMSTAILKGLGSDNDLKIAAYRLLDQMDPGPEKSMATAPGPPAPAEVQEEGKRSSENVVEHLRNGVTMIFDYVDRTNFAAIGTFGIIGLLFMVLMMLNSIETTMNVIWHNQNHRPWGRKLMNYLALLVLLPVSLNAAFAGNAILQSERIMNVIRTVVASDWLIQIMLKELPLLCLVFSLTLMYRFFPYAKVRTLPALAGALFAALAWLFTLQAYIHLQIGVARYNAIYGSFATLPLFLIWMHLGWLFLLLGAALAYAIQNRDRYLPQSQLRLSPALRLQMAWDVLVHLYEDFVQGQVTDERTLVQRLAYPDATSLREVLVAMSKEGLIRRIDEDEPAVSPAWPRERFPVQRLVDLFLGPLTDRDDQEMVFARTVLNRAREAAGSLRLPSPQAKEERHEHP